MQNQTYDEDLSSNEFFNSIQNHQNGELFRKAVEFPLSFCDFVLFSMIEFLSDLKEPTFDDIFQVESNDFKESTSSFSIRSNILSNRSLGWLILLFIESDQV